MEGTIYMTLGYRALISVASSEANVTVWHQRLGYMSEKGMKVMHSKDTTSGLKSIMLGWARSHASGPEY